MSIPVNMPQVGQDIESAVITEWKVREGDSVRAGDIIALVESDKAVFEVEAFEAGTVLRLLYEEGDEARVLEPIAFVGSPGESLEPENAPPRPGEAGPGKAGPGAEVPVEGDAGISPSRTSASPSARRLAREKNIDLGRISGSGPNGRIIKEDVIRAANETRAEGTVPALDSDRAIPYSRIRQAIADRMTRSASTIPHFYLFAEADLTDALAWRDSLNLDQGIKVSVNDLVLKAAARALALHPGMNAHVEPRQVVLKKDINIGIAVSVEEGLIVPVLAGADKMNILEISKAAKDLAARAREGVMKPGFPGTFTISNLGMFSISRFLPIINPPEAAILGVGSTGKQLVPGPGNSVAVRDRLNLALACDHRAVDGVMAAKFLQSVKEQLEIHYEE